MKIWITRTSAFQIQCGGLDRLQVWFKKPIWTESKFEEEIDMPFGTYLSQGCFVPNGWGVHGGKVQQNVSFGGVFGYEGKIPEYVWNKLCEHFGNSEFREWENYEKENPDCCVKNFLLSIELDINIKP